MEGLETEVEHAHMPCPGCGERVHVVVRRPAARSRWVCLACRTWGTGPFFDAQGFEEHDDLEPPIPSAV